MYVSKTEILLWFHSANTTANTNDEDDSLPAKKIKNKMGVAGRKKGEGILELQKEHEGTENYTNP